jgi:hypothetical protein
MLKELLSMAKYDPDADGRTFVILGAGAAGSAAVEGTFPLPFALCPPRKGSFALFPFPFCKLGLARL